MAQEQFDARTARPRSPRPHRSVTARMRRPPARSSARAARPMPSVHAARQLIDVEERMRLAAQSADLLRNAVARRDALLAEQRSAYYKSCFSTSPSARRWPTHRPRRRMRRRSKGLPSRSARAFLTRACLRRAIWPSTRRWPTRRRARWSRRMSRRRRRVRRRVWRWLGSRSSSSRSVELGEERRSIRRRYYASAAAHYPTDTAAHSSVAAALPSDSRAPSSSVPAGT